MLLSSTFSISTSSWILRFHFGPEQGLLCDHDWWWRQQYQQWQAILRITSLHDHRAVSLTLSVGPRAIKGFRHRRGRDQTLLSYCIYSKTRVSSCGICISRSQHPTISAGHAFLTQHLWNWDASHHCQPCGSDETWHASLNTPASSLTLLHIKDGKRLFSKFPESRRRNKCNPYIFFFLIFIFLLVGG